MQGVLVARDEVVAAVHEHGELELAGGRVDELSGEPERDPFRAAAADVDQRGVPQELDLLVVVDGEVERRDAPLRVADHALVVAAAVEPEAVAEKGTGDAGRGGRSGVQPEAEAHGDALGQGEFPGHVPQQEQLAVRGIGQVVGRFGGIAHVLQGQDPGIAAVLALPGELLDPDSAVGHGALAGRVAVPLIR